MRYWYQIMVLCLAICVTGTAVIKAADYTEELNRTVKELRFLESLSVEADKTFLAGDYQSSVKLYQQIERINPFDYRSTERLKQSQLAARHLQDAESAFLEGKYQLSGTFLENIVHINEFDPQAQRQLVSCKLAQSYLEECRRALQAKDYQSALEYATKLAKLNSQDQWAKKILGAADVLSKGYQAWLEENYFVATAYYEQAGQILPKEQTVLNAINEAHIIVDNLTTADKLYLAHRLTEARVFYNRVLEIHETNQIAIARLSAINSIVEKIELADKLFSDGKFSQASTIYQEVIRLDPGNSELDEKISYCLRVQAFLKNAADFFPASYQEEAQGYMSKVSEIITKRNLQTLDNLHLRNRTNFLEAFQEARAYFARGNFEQAVIRYQQAKTYTADQLETQRVAYESELAKKVLLAQENSHRAFAVGDYSNAKTLAELTQLLIEKLDDPNPANLQLASAEIPIPENPLFQKRTLPSAPLEIPKIFNDKVFVIDSEKVENMNLSMPSEMRFFRVYHPQDDNYLNNGTRTRQENLIARGQYQEVDLLKINDYIVPTFMKDGKFYYKTPLNIGRNEIVISAVGYDGYREHKKYTVFRLPGFTDLKPTQYEYGNIVLLGIMTGFPDNTFRPEDNFNSKYIVVVQERVKELSTDNSISKMQAIVGLQKLKDQDKLSRGDIAAFLLKQSYIQEMIKKYFEY